MKRILLYIDNEYSGTGGAQYTKSFLDALFHISKGQFNFLIIYTRKEWELHLKMYPDFEIIYFKRPFFLIKIYQILISIGLFGVAKKFTRSFDKTVKFIEKKSFDLIIFPSADTLGCLISGKSLVVVHDLMHRYERKFRESGNFIRYHYRENYYKNVLLSAEAIVVDSELGKKQITDSYCKITSRINVLPYIAPYGFYKLNENKTAGDFLNSEQSQYLFYPAMFCPHKNHKNLIKAISILRDKGIEINLLLGGKRILEYNKLSRLVKDLKLEKQVKFSGYIPDEKMGYYYKNALAMIMPTFYGPTNIPPIEAILMDCIPIVSNNYAMPEQFEDAALYFNPHDPVSIAESIELLIRDKELKDRLHINGQRIKSKFSRERFESDLYNILMMVN